MESLKTEQRKLDAKFEEAFKEELRSLAEAIADSSKSAEETQATAKCVSYSFMVYSLLKIVSGKLQMSWVESDGSCEWRRDIRTITRRYLAHDGPFAHISISYARLLISRVSCSIITSDLVHTHLFDILSCTY